MNALASIFISCQQQQNKNNKKNQRNKGTDSSGCGNRCFLRLKFRPSDLASSTGFHYWLFSPHCRKFN